MITGKVWGETECVIDTPVNGTHLLNILPKMQCSLHRHKNKWNAFGVVSGTLYIDTVTDDFRPPDVTVLGPGGVTTVPPGQFHRFRTGDEPCVAFEWYYPETLSEDIERRNHGGPVED